jgi:hypothetical protein
MILLWLSIIDKFFWIITTEGDDVKGLYNEKDDTYSEVALKLDTEAQDAIQPIFDKYVELGYSFRQISHVILSTVWECELTNIFNRKV